MSKEDVWNLDESKQGGNWYRFLYVQSWITKNIRDPNNHLRISFDFQNNILRRMVPSTYDIR